MKKYHYTESGLENIVLVNGFSIDKEGNLFIEDIHGLHKAIAKHLVFLPQKLSGKEVRFLRHYLDLSQTSLGETLGVDYQSVHRWETGKTQITKTADFLLRLYAYGYINGNARIVKAINAISDLDNNRPTTKAEFACKNGEWKMAA